VHRYVCAEPIDDDVDFVLAHAHAFDGEAVEKLRQPGSVQAQLAAFGRE